MREEGWTYIEVEDFAGDRHGEKLFGGGGGWKSAADSLTNVCGDMGDLGKSLRGLLFDLVLAGDGHYVRQR